MMIEKEKSNQKRLFGNLLGTLQTIEKEITQNKQKIEKRNQVNKKVQEKLLKEKLEFKLQRELEKQKEIEKEKEITKKLIEEYNEKLKGFRYTKTRPEIAFFICDL
jgi:DNA gyrase/topoisomerase IV subunit A